MGTINCKICSSSTELLLIGDSEYHTCSNCGFISLSEGFYPEFEDARERYLLHNNSIENAGYVAMLENFISSCVEPFVAEGSRVLDFGSGPQPVLAELMRRRGWDVDIYDIHFAPERSYENKSYDIITSTEVFEHLVEPKDVMRKLVGLLNVGGMLAIMTSFHPEDPEIFRNWRYRMDSTHLCFFARRTMVHMAQIFRLDVLLMDDKNLSVLKSQGNPKV